MIMCVHPDQWTVMKDTGVYLFARAELDVTYTETGDTERVDTRGTVKVNSASNRHVANMFVAMEPLKIKGNITLIDCYYSDNIGNPLSESTTTSKVFTTNITSCTSYCDY